MAETEIKIDCETESGDRELVDDFLAGNESAFNRLVLKYQDKVYNAALRMLNNREDALEVAQDAFVRVYRNAEKFKWNCAFQTWLYTIALNLSRSRYKKRKRSGEHIKLSLDNPLKQNDGSETKMEIADEKLSPKKEATRREMRQQIQDGLAALGPDFREIVVLRHIEGLSYDRIGEILKLPAGTVKSRLHRAREELQRLLKGLL